MRRKHHITIRTDSGNGVKARRLAVVENKGKPVSIHCVYLVHDPLTERPTGESDYIFHRSSMF